jgi:hypothetical protein
MKQLFSTPDIAAIMGVAPRIVNRWFDAKRMNGERHPETFEREVTRSQLMAFLKNYKHGTLDENDVLHPLEEA